MTIEASRLTKIGMSVTDIVEKVTLLRANSGFYAAVKI